MEDLMGESMRILLLGAGTMARQHAAAARALGRAVELHAADPSADAREAFGSAFPEALLHDDVDAMLAEPAREGDLAIVATPPWLHRTHIEAAVRSGRHVLGEKPLLMAEEDLRPVAQLLEETGRVLGCCSVRFLANPATREVARLIEDGELGDVYAVRWLQGFHRMRSGIEWQPESPWFMDRSRNGGGVVMDWAPYDLTILDSLFAPRRVTVLHAAMSQPELSAELAADAVFDVETHAVATLLYEVADGRRIPIHFERQSGSFERDLAESTINGTKGSVSWTCQGWEGAIEIALRNAADEDGKTRVLAPPGEDWFDRAPLFSMIDRLEGRPAHALTGADALFQAAILRALYSAAERGEPVTVERADWAGAPVAPPKS